MAATYGRQVQELLARYRAVLAEDHTQSRTSAETTALLCSLDATDVDNACGVPPTGRTEDTPWMAPSGKRRRRLPPRWRSADVVAALHEAEVETEEGGDAGPRLGDADRRRRAAPSRQHSRRRRSLWGISQRALACAAGSGTPPVPAADDGGGAGTARARGAALRRDLHRWLAAADTAAVRAVLARGGPPDGDRDGAAVAAALRDLMTALLARAAARPAAPSLRLAAVLAADALGDPGRRALLRAALAAADAPRDVVSSLRLAAEVVAEGRAYEDPRALLDVAARLMRRALRAPEEEDDAADAAASGAEVRRALAHVWVRRRGIFAALHREAADFPAKRELDVYRRLCAKMSVRYGSLSSWVSPTMSHDVKERVILALQAEGILSLFCCGESECGDQTATAKEYPFSFDMSLRVAHERMGPSESHDCLLSDPAAYHLSSIEMGTGGSILRLHKPSAKGSGAHLLSSDLLGNIFSYLGYRSLARAAQCCTSWRAPGETPALWARLYFKKFSSARFEEELACGIDGARDDAHFGSFLSLRHSTDRQTFAASTEGYDWKYIFWMKYKTTKGGRLNTCQYVGCSYVIRRCDHARLHTIK